MRWLIGVVLATAGCGGALLPDNLLDGSPGVDAGFDTTIPDGPGWNDAPPPCTVPPTCSPDLHTVLDCHGQVIEQCPDDQGCAGSTCVPACNATDIAASTPDHLSYPGCTFYSVVPDVLANNNLEGGCYVVALTNAWTSPMTVTVDRAGSVITGSFIRIPSGTGSSMTYTTPSNGQIPAGATALLFLSRSPGGNPACPTGITPGITTDPAVHGTAYGDAFHITTTMPAFAADYVPYGATAFIASASVLIPTHSWGTSNVVVDGYTASTVSGGVPSTDIVAMQDNTQLTIFPVADITGSGTVTGGTANKPASYTLNKGQILQFTQASDLSGSVVQSSAPIAIWGAHTCMNIDPSTPYCDSAHQQLPSITHWGHDYVGVRYKNRTSTEETPPWRLVGLSNGAALTWDPPIAGAPTTLSQGQVATVNAAGPFRVSSQGPQYPFYLSAHMTGGGPFANTGDPEFVNVAPSQVWREGYTFFTQPGFPETSLVVVRSSVLGGFQDVTLDCAGKLGGWTAIDSANLYQYTRIDLSAGSFVGQNGCDNGVHAATSAGPFTITAWGWGNTQTNTYSVSYALPSGM